MKRAQLWHLYFFLYLVLGLYSIFNLIQLKLTFQLIRATILWFPAVFGLYLFIKARKRFSPLFWRFYFLYYLMDIIYEWFWVRDFLSTHSAMTPMAINLVYSTEVLFLLPSAVALYNISFRRT
ncbi:MAG: hypothetical protein NC936_00535 [Candidatus Omnitrophica bacterium]|nr:hypothetical protein [Candidatus Omnitrophota bacterium]